MYALMPLAYAVRIRLPSGVIVGPLGVVERPAELRAAAPADRVRSRRDRALRTAVLRARAATTPSPRGGPAPSRSPGRRTDRRCSSRRCAARPTGRERPPPARAGPERFPCRPASRARCGQLPRDRTKTRGGGLHLPGATCGEQADGDCGQCGTKQATHLCDLQLSNRTSRPCASCRRSVPDLTSFTGPSAVRRASAKVIVRRTHRHRARLL